MLYVKIINKAQGEIENCQKLKTEFLTNGKNGLKDYYMAAARSLNTKLSEMMIDVFIKLCAPFF